MPAASAQPSMACYCEKQTCNQDNRYTQHIVFLENSMSLPSLRLKANADRRLRSGHLWLYSNEIDTKLSPLSAFKVGDQAIVENAAGKPLGVALLSPQTLVCARLVSRDIEHRAVGHCSEYNSDDGQSTSCSNIGIDR